MSAFTPIKASDGWSGTNDFDAAYDQDSPRDIEALLLGHSVSKVAEDHLLLDDGTLLKLVGHEGGCACSAGCYDLTALNGVENIITAVEFEDSPGDEGSPCPTCNNADGYCYDKPDHVGSGNGTYRIFVLAGDQRINLAEFVGSDGNGYYGTGYHVLVRRSAVSR